MRSRWLLPLVLVALLLAPAAAGDKKKKVKKKEPQVPIASAKTVKHELKVFEREFKTADIDFKLEAVIRLAKCVHKDVVKELLKVLYKDPDTHIRAEAAKGLRKQVPFAKDIGKKTLRLLTDDKTDHRILTQLITTLGTLKYTAAWEKITELISHHKDDVVVAAFKTLGYWKELRAWREIQSFWDVYPDEGKFKTGSVTVDTGAAGDVDQRAAKRKWMAKYGSKRNQRVRPECVKALKAAVKKITGDDLKKPAEFREWCKEHKKDIKKAEAKKD